MEIKIGVEKSKPALPNSHATCIRCISHGISIDMAYEPHMWKMYTGESSIFRKLAVSVIRDFSQCQWPLRPSAIVHRFGVHITILPELASPYAWRAPGRTDREPHAQGQGGSHWRLEPGFAKAVICCKFHPLRHRQQLGHQYVIPQKSEACQRL